MPGTDIIVAVLAVLALINGVQAGVVARLFAWLGVAGGILLLPTTVPLVADLIPTATVTRTLLVRIAVSVATVVAGALLGTLLGRAIRVGVRLTPLSLLDRLGGVVFSLLVVGFLVTSVLMAAAQLPGGVGDDVRRSVSYAQAQRAVELPLRFFELLPDTLMDERFSDPEDAQT